MKILRYDWKGALCHARKKHGIPLQALGLVQGGDEDDAPLSGKELKKQMKVGSGVWV